MVIPNPWPDEQPFLQGGDLEFVRHYGGTLTNEILDQAEKAGILEPDHRLFLNINVRCTYQRAGEYQHYRTDWHRDISKKSWVYVLGPGPTQFRDEDKIWDIEQGVLTCYDNKEHRCPVQPEDGWRYFFRVLWMIKPSSNTVRDRVK